MKRETFDKWINRINFGLLYLLVFLVTIIILFGVKFP
jgi:hypothetical protein